MPTHPFSARVLAGLAAAFFLTGWSLLPAQAADADPVAIGPEARQNLALTLYQDGFALVEDVRTVPVTVESTPVRFIAVPSSLIAASAQVSPAGSAPGFAVHGLIHTTALADRQSLLRANVGREVTVLRYAEDGTVVRERARILRAEPEVLAEIDGRIHVGLPGTVVFDALPPGLPVQPGLTAIVEGTTVANVQVALRYLTHGLSWTADHVLTLDATREAADLTTWATVANDTDVAWPDAEMAVVAGDVNAPPPPTEGPALRTMTAAMEEKAVGVAQAAGPAREALGGTHVYRFPETVDLAPRETRQLRLLGAEALGVDVLYEDEGGVHVYRAPFPEERQTHPATIVVLENAAEGGLGAPLPAGPARVYAEDATDRVRFLGQDVLPATPVGEEARLTLGRAFELTVERVQTAFRRLSENVIETSHTVVVRNGGDTSTTVRVIESLPGDWEMVAESQPHERLDASRVLWPVPVQAKGTTELTYTVRSRF